MKRPTSNPPPGRWRFAVAVIFLAAGPVIAVGGDEPDATELDSGIRPLPGLAEVYFSAQHLSGNTVEGVVHGNRVSVNFGDGLVFGAGVGGRGRYLGIGMEALLGGLNWDGRIEDGPATHEDAVIYGLDVNTSLLLRKPGVSPVMGLCAGITGLLGDTDDYFEDTVEFSYGAVAGLRWTMKSGMFLEASYRWRRIDVADTDDNTRFDGVRILFGMCALPE